MLAKKRGVEMMTVGPIGQFTIDNEVEADDYLKALLEKPEYRSMDEARVRAEKYIKDDHLKNHFINRAKELLNA
jgi:hypothetical protein